MLFKGEISYEKLFEEMSYKELLSIRDARIKRLVKEREEQEKINKEMEAAEANR